MIIDRELTPKEYFEGKFPSRTYTSRRLTNKYPDGTTREIRIVSKVIDSPESWTHIKLKNEIVLRITPGGRQEIVAKVYEDTRGVFVLSIQRYTSENGNPHEINFSFVGKEIGVLRNFIDSIKFLDFSDPSKSKIEDEEIEKARELLMNSSNLDFLIEMMQKNITKKDVVALAYRKEQLEIFRKMLYENYLEEYKKIINKEESKDEIVWQCFFNQNPWIFGYGLDYRFMGILQKEFSASGTEADGSGQVNGDFLMGDKKFTTFIELKKPDTSIFKNSLNRAGAWKLSTELMEAKSQILEQKASGQIKIETAKIHNESGEEIEQSSYDSKTILIIGNWDEIANDSDLIKKTKQKTFELFRRDSRNIEIITYDELYERAQFIVKNK